MLIIAQRHDKVGGLAICGKGGPDMAATNSLGGTKISTVDNSGAQDRMFCHGQSGGTK